MTMAESEWPWDMTRSSEANGLSRDAETAEWQARVAALERELQALKEEVRRLRHQKVEYRIDQLHIQSLEGILNIGLSTNTDEEQLAALQALHAKSPEEKSSGTDGTDG